MDPEAPALIRSPTAADLRSAGWVRTSRRERLIQSTPRVGRYFWIDFPHDAYPPEFVGEHPGIVIRAARRLHDTCIVVPLTSRPQPGVPHAYGLKRNPNPKGEADGVIACAICDHLYTIHIARLRPLRDRTNRPFYPRADVHDMQGIFTAIRGALPAMFRLPESK